jgi:hypothetical protein
MSTGLALGNRLHPRAHVSAEILKFGEELASDRKVLSIAAYDAQLTTRCCIQTLSIAACDAQQVTWCRIQTLCIESVGQLTSRLSSTWRVVI